MKKLRWLVLCALVACTKKTPAPTEPATASATATATATASATATETATASGSLVPTDVSPPQSEIGIAAVCGTKSGPLPLDALRFGKSITERLKRPIFTFDSQGGTRQGHDEHLAVDEDGRFIAARTTDSAIVGVFAGTLDAAALADVKRIAGAVTGDSAQRASSSSGQALHAVSTVRGGISVRSGDAVSDPAWSAMVSRAVLLLDEAKRAPWAAVELTTQGNALRLEHRGCTAVEVDLRELDIEELTPSATKFMGKPVSERKDRSLSLGTKKLAAGESVDLTAVTASSVSAAFAVKSPFAIARAHPRVR